MIVVVNYGYKINVRKSGNDTVYIYIYIYIYICNVYLCSLGI